MARLGLPAALALAIVSAIVALLLLPRGHHASPTELAFVAVAVPALLAPLFWPRECPSVRRLLVSALGPVAAFVVTCCVLRVLHGAVALQGVVLAGLVAVLMLAVLHQLAALIEPVVRRLGASESSAREWSLWSVTALLWLAAAAPAWLGPAADLGARTDPRWPSFVLGSSPLAHLASASGYDVLRGQWFYAHSSLGALQVDYPRVATLLIAYALALVALTLLGRAEAAHAACAGAAGRARCSESCRALCDPARSGSGASLGRLDSSRAHHRTRYPAALASSGMPCG